MGSHPGSFGNGIQQGSVLTTGSGVVLRLTSLVITNGSGAATGLLPGFACGGIVSNGTLTTDGSTITGSTADRDIGDSFGNGGGIS